MTQLVTLEGFAPSAGNHRAPPRVHLLRADAPLAFLVEGSRLFEIDESLYTRIESGEQAAESDLLDAAGASPGPPRFDNELRPPAAISLNIAQACNLSCSYCYADEGRFGGDSRLMPLDVAVAAIDHVLSGADGRRVTIGFIGGEPFVNRPVLHRAVAYASARARALGVRAGFSVTTNATLLDANDLELLREHAFTVSVSLDGSGDMNDRHRRAHDGSSAAAQAIARIRPLLDRPGRARVCARATLTRLDLRVAERVAALGAHGFDDVGVSPLRTSPDSGLILDGDDWSLLLREMIRAAEVEWTRLEAGARWRFSNLATAVKQIHQGAARTLPCGSADNYVSVSARGEYFTCHRTIDNPQFYLGTGAAEEGRRMQFLSERQVDRQEPCRTCWARYLCGGGCHAEVLTAGRSGCDYIRGWLDYCLGFYDRVLRTRPDLFTTS